MTEKKHQSVMHELKGTQPLDALHTDSIEINNQLTTREWVRMTDIDRQSWLCPEKQMITSDKWNDYFSEARACTSWGKTSSDTKGQHTAATGALRPCPRPGPLRAKSIFLSTRWESRARGAECPNRHFGSMVSNRQGKAHLAYLLEEREWGDMRPLDNRIAARTEISNPALPAFCSC